MMGISRRVLLSVLAGVVTSLVLNWVLDWINPVDIDGEMQRMRLSMCLPGCDWTNCSSSLTYNNHYHSIIDYWILFVTAEYYKDKRVVVTGASKGIGRELAIQLANAGAE